jgi:hypothetical protein
MLTPPAIKLRSTAALATIPYRAATKCVETAFRFWTGPLALKVARWSRALEKPSAGSAGPGGPPATGLGGAMGLTLPADFQTDRPNYLCGPGESYTSDPAAGAGKRIVEIAGEIQRANLGRGGAWAFLPAAEGRFPRSGRHALLLFGRTA